MTLQPQCCMSRARAAMKPEAYHIPHGPTEETLPIHSIPFPVARGMPLGLWARDLGAPDPARLSASLLVVDSPLPIAPMLLCSDRVCAARQGADSLVLPQLQFSR